MRIGLLFVLILGIRITVAQDAGIIIKSGAHWVNKGAVNVVIKNASLNDEGNFSADQSLILIRGDVGASSTIINTDEDLYDLEVDKVTDGAQLGQNLTVTNSLTLTSGYLDLVDYDLIITGAQIIGESPSNYITGNEGEVIYTMDLNAPSAVDPGNMGIQLTSAANLGSTTVSRGHLPATEGGNSGIHRVISINPTNNSGLDATFRFYYRDGELNGLDENDLEFWRFNGTAWEKRGFTSRNITENWVELTGIDAFSSWTLSTDASPLPIVLQHFNGFIQGNNVQLNWSTASEINNDFFTISRSANGIDFSELVELPGAGTANGANHYQWTDQNPLTGTNYYLLTQTDFDGTKATFEPILVEFLGEELSIQYFPNPTADHLTIHSNLATPVQVALIDLNGVTVFTQSIDTENNSVTLKDMVPAGTYVLRVKDYQGVLILNELLVVK